ncbi:cell wall hydrolase [Pseudorhodoplanes sp.]|uniref:cell wall hydrolase n=1 Tax=Pseudorhodoplanes sp. TaxID=1934341 RepID=UPI00391B34FF
MKASRRRPKGAFRRPFGLVLCVVVVMPNAIGHQDLAALIASQPAVTERWRAHIRSSTFRTVHTAALNFPRPVGSAIPDPYFTQLAALDPRALEATGSVPLSVPIEPVVTQPTYEFPVVERRLKGDRLDVKQLPSGQPQEQPAQPARKKDHARVEEALPKADRIAPQAGAEAAAERMPVRRRAGIPAGQATLAKQVLGTGPRQVRPVAASVEAVAERKPRRPGLAAAHLNKLKRGIARIDTLPFETADLESARSDLREPLVAPQRQYVETADLESQRADLNGLLASAPESVIATAAEAEPPLEAVKVAESPRPAAEPDQALEEQPVPGLPDVVPPAQEKVAGRFNNETVDQLAQLANPNAQTRVFFGTHALGMGRSSWEAWEPDQVPTVLAPPHVDTEIKRAAREPDAEPDPHALQGGETIAPKGEVTGEGKRPRTPAERLNLSGASRVKHHRCLANAIYFEARGEVERGQMAVAQVVLNRVFTGYYPGNVCDVVYQNAHRKLACQFTFACDNVKDVVRDQKAWEVATRIADEALDGKFWLPEVGKATHYHATYVSPWWVRTMTKHTRLGVHIFYRPKRWGDGEDIPVWGDKLDLTASIRREAQPAAPASSGADRRADAHPATPARRSIFDPVEPINLPGG